MRRPHNHYTKIWRNNTPVEGFDEQNIDKVFNRFYSNRPEKFGEHSGLGLNIVKNIVELHGGSIFASNNSGRKKGARIEVLLPIYQ